MRIIACSKLTLTDRLCEPSCRLRLLSVAGCATRYRRPTYRADCFSLVRRFGKGTIMFRRILATACAIVTFGFLVAACGKTDGDRATTIGLFGPRANSYFNAYVDAGEAWAKEHGIELKIFDSGFDPLQQFSQIDDAIGRHAVDGMVITPLNGAAIAPLVKKAKDLGIHSVAIDAPLSADFNSLDPTTVPGLDGLVMIPANERGENLGLSAVEACRGLDPCKVIYEAILMNQPAEVSIYDSFKSTLEKHSNIELLGVRDKCMGQRDTALGVTQDLLQATPDVNVIVSADQCLIGAQVAIERAGKSYGTEPGQIRLVGGGGTTQGIQQVLAGKWVSTLTGLPRQEMTDGLDILKQAIDGTLAAPKGVNPLEGAKYPPIMNKAAVEETGFQGQYSA